MDDNRRALDAFRDAWNSGEMSSMQGVLAEYAADDFVEEWPQSGERIRGKEAATRIGEQYSDATGTQPRGKVRRISGGGDVYVVEGTIDYGDGTPVSYVGIAEFRDGKVTRMTEYFANPFEAPEWRKGMVERMEPVGV